MTSAGSGRASRGRGGRCAPARPAAPAPGSPGGRGAGASLAVAWARLGRPRCPAGGADLEATPGLARAQRGRGAANRGPDSEREARPGAGAAPGLGGGGEDGWPGPGEAPGLGPPQDWGQQVARAWTVQELGGGGCAHTDREHPAGIGVQRPWGPGRTLGVCCLFIDTGPPLGGGRRGTRLGLPRKEPRGQGRSARPSRGRGGGGSLAGQVAGARAVAPVASHEGVGSSPGCSTSRALPADGPGAGATAPVPETRMELPVRPSPAFGK